MKNSRCNQLYFINEKNAGSDTDTRISDWSSGFGPFCATTLPLGKRKKLPFNSFNSHAVITVF